MQSEPRATGEPHGAARPAALATAFGAYALGGGIASFLGWVADVRGLTDWFDTGISIQPNTCIAGVASGLAVLLLARGRRHAGAALGAAVSAVGVSALVQYLAGVHLESLNTLLLFGREWGRTGVVEPGRMGPPSAVCWTLMGVALALASAPQGSRARRAVPPLALATLGVAMLSMVGYLYDADPLYTQPHLTAIAFQTATFIAALSVASMALVSDLAPVRWLQDPGATGTVARRLVPFVVLVPPLVGWLRLTGEVAGLYDARFGVAVLVLTFMALTFAMLSWNLATLERHEQALRRSQQRVVETLQSVTDACVAFDRRWRYVLVNDRAARLLDKRPDELLGRSLWEVFPEARGGTDERELLRVAAQRTSVEYESFEPTRGRWFSSRAYPTPDGGIAVYFRDVTERKRAAQRMEQDLAALTSLHALATKLVHAGDLHSLLREILAAACDLVGTSKGNIRLHDAKSGRLRIAVHQGLGPRFVERFAEGGWQARYGAAARKHPRVLIEDVAQADGVASAANLALVLEEGIRGVQSTPLVSRGGALLGVLSNHFTAPHLPSEREQRYLDLLARMAADFIERAQAEQALREADRRKDEFLAMLAHELRNPLAPMRNGVQILRESRGDAVAARAATDVLDRQVDQMVRLVDDLLDVSRITRGRIDLRKRRVELAAVARQAVEDNRPLVARMGHTLDVVATPQPIPLQADAARLSQVIGNLLSNACKFTPRGGHIELRIEREGDHALVRVRDDGIGIAAEDLPRLFDLFVQVDTSLERSAGGLGIGLTLVKSLVELHGGEVAVRSDGPGLGSEFSLRLPIGPEATVSPSEAAAPRASRVPWRRVLIVDDNADSTESLALLLARRGHEVRAANDGFRAIELAREFRPDLVLLDIGMPGLNGYETCQRIRKEPWGSGITMVAVTGWGQEQDRRMARSAGFDAHVVKPLDLDVLMSLVATLPGGDSAGAHA
ncbi:MAG TPA: ATP-binding protein [Myxococcota bacterium]|nr:ATP-binding protein [Myxococcota bacterium]